MVLKKHKYFNCAPKDRLHIKIKRRDWGIYLLQSSYLRAAKVRLCETAVNLQVNKSSLAANPS
jgi:hypothetical protein